MNMFVVFDDQVGLVIGIRNRLNGLLTQIPPSLERTLGPRLHHPRSCSLLNTVPHQPS